MMNPKVTVIIPTYERAHFIKSAVESVLNQTYDDFELIVVDDGSTDGTKEILEGYADKLLYVRQQRQKRSAARNKGVSLARGEYVAFLDSDDVWFPDKLERQVPVLDNAPRNTVLVHGYKQIVDADLNPISAHKKQLRRSYAQAEKGKETYEAYLRSHCIFTSTVLIRRAELLGTGNYDPLINGREDLDLYLRLLLKGYEFAFCPEPPLVKYRLDKDRTDAAAIDESYLQVYKKHLELCARLKEDSRIAGARRSLYQNIAQTYYRLGDFRKSKEFWRKALKESWVTVMDVHFWKEESVIAANSLLKYGEAKKRIVENYDKI